MGPNGAHVVPDIRAQFANLVVLCRGADVLGLEMSIHGNVALKSLFTHRALEAELRLELLLARSCR
jgi:hypothetical protein